MLRLLKSFDAQPRLAVVTKTLYTAAVDTWLRFFASYATARRISVMQNHMDNMEHEMNTGFDWGSYRGSILILIPKPSSQETLQDPTMQLKPYASFPTHAGPQRVPYLCGSPRISCSCLVG